MSPRDGNAENCRIIRNDPRWSAELFRKSARVPGVSDAAAGAPWPNGEYGEVVSPSGRRAYLAAQAGRLAGRTPRWATELANRHDSPVESERGHIVGRKGAEAWFLIADSLEQHLRTIGLWPPTANQQPTQDFEQLLMLQGADLEASRRREQELQAEVERLQQDRNELLDTIATLSQTIASLSQVSKAVPAKPAH